jgi:polyisoprenoid-binding protein YceI
MKRYIIFLGIIFLSSVNAEQLNFKNDNFNSAIESENFIKFIGSSTKGWIVTTDFTGVAKEFRIDYKKEKSELKEVSIEIAAASLDTDNESRNEKMQTLCLKSKEYPTIKAKLIGTVALIEVTEATIPVELAILSETKLRSLSYSIVKRDAEYIVKFSTDFSFKDFGIEDPSIFVAKVKEVFKVQGQVVVK